MGLAFLIYGGALIGTLGLESSSLGSGSKRELAVVGGPGQIISPPRSSRAATNPGGTGEIDAPIQETVALLGF